MGHQDAYRDAALRIESIDLSRRWEPIPRVTWVPPRSQSSFDRRIPLSHPDAGRQDSRTHNGPFWDMAPYRDGTYQYDPSHSLHHAEDSGASVCHVEAGIRCQSRRSSIQTGRSEESPDTANTTDDSRRRWRTPCPGMRSRPGAAAARCHCR